MVSEGEGTIMKMRKSCINVTCCGNDYRNGNWLRQLIEQKLQSLMQRKERYII